MKRDLDKFHLMKVFHSVAVKGSFTGAAKTLGMTTPSVSKAVQQLEDSLQVKLLYRTTRSQSLTDSGIHYLSKAKHILADISELEEQLHQQGNQPSGTLRITAPTSIGQFLLAPRLHTFTEANPHVCLELSLTDTVADITGEGFDIAIRSLEAPPNSPFYSKKLGTHTPKLVAAPECLSQAGMPDTPEQLNALNLINYSGSQAFAQWNFTRDDKAVTLEPRAIYTSNNYYALYQAARTGIGVANLYQYLVDEDIKNGALIHLCPEWHQQARPLYAIYQQRRDTSPKLDAFLSFLETLM